MEILQVAAYSIAGGLLGYFLPKLGWDLAASEKSRPAKRTSPAPQRFYGGERAGLQEQRQYQGPAG